MKIEQIHKLCANGALRWTNHIMMRLLQREIGLLEVKEALMCGEVIEEYPEDYPYPSCLVLGITSKDRRLHVVCGTDGKELWLITAYIPNPDEWEQDLRTRKECKK